MKLKALATPFALFAGLTLGAGAFAQTPIGTITVTDEQLPHVQAYCEDLAGEHSDADSDSDDSEAGPLEEVQTPNIDLSSITIDDCEEAGLVE
ncbi:hypothetical protein [Pelagibacterium xiamenense]|uniref:hypothetical protein n=1 Tax=Pelagibacterium xiamenense TaxID=2901140 RepID=UPI001E5A6626|nr:hypothetical protein [Pelagibacterium xiamenense]MCD7060038.1 hypothetical protein [Pelagibacterium xiamenense]